jgi:putative transposase
MTPTRHPLPRRKKAPRLKTFDYKGFHAYLLTVTTWRRRPWLTRPERVEVVRRELSLAASRRGFHVLCYCFMPDHVHVLLRGMADGSDLLAFVHEFKQTTAFGFRRETGASLWQNSFHDHVLRQDEAVDDAALYLLNNPVRKGLVRDWQRYPFSGGPLKWELAGGNISEGQRPPDGPEGPSLQ